MLRAAGCLYKNEYRKLEQSLKIQKLVWIVFLLCEPRVTGISGSIWSPWDLGWRERLSVGRHAQSLIVVADLGPPQHHYRQSPEAILRRYPEVPLLTYVMLRRPPVLPLLLNLSWGLKGLSINCLKTRSMMMAMITLRAFGKTDLQNHLNRSI